MTAAPATLAVDLGGTNMRCALVAPGGRVQSRREVPTPHDGRGPEALTDLMAQVRADAESAQECAAAVVGVPGRVNYRSGTLEYAPNLPAGWVGKLGQAELGATLDLPVSLANDADLAAVGEAWFGAGRGVDDVAYLTLSTGVGAGVVLARQLVHGHRSMAEVGHTIIDLQASEAGRPATVEDLASGTAFGRMAAEAGLHGSGAELDAAVRARDPAALAVWDEVVAAAAATVVNLAWLFSPQTVVIGGGLGLVGDLLLEPMRTALAKSGPPALDEPITVVRASLGDDAGLIGAAAWREAFAPDDGVAASSSRARA
jgi:glucokinase